MKCKFVVLDASVLLKWILPFKTERDVAQALAIRDSYVAGNLNVRLPTLWIYEVGNTVNRLYPEHAGNLIVDLLDYRFSERHLDKELVQKASHLCRKYKATFYDAAYHAVALEDGGIFVTADNQYVSSARSAGSVASLKDFVI